MGALKPKGIQNMKRYSSIVYIVSLALCRPDLHRVRNEPGDRANTA